MTAKAIRPNIQTETDVAVLQVKVENIEQDVVEIKEDIKSLSLLINKRTEDTHSMLKDIAEKAEVAHKGLSNKISGLEKWRWMLMGAGIVIGSLGFETLSKLLK